MLSRPGIVAVLLLASLASLAAAVPGGAQAPVDPGDFGDAPEGTLAYPATRVIGRFPTCLGGPEGYVRHAGVVSSAFWGRSADAEPDGNGGGCLGAAYESDECCGIFDGDAGLILPDAYTIAGGQVVPCGDAPHPRALGVACGRAAWGVPAGVELLVVNHSREKRVVNLLVDWNQDGKWGGSVTCGGETIDEHVLRDFAVPKGYVGMLSGLNPPAIRIGPYPGFVWARFTLSEEVDLPADWDGSGSFRSGETEDYLLRVDGEAPPAGELGDAPDGVDAYPGVEGRFPTCLHGSHGSVVHRGSPRCWFGGGADVEADGNAGACAQAPYDRDECLAGGLAAGGADAGLLRPTPYTWGEGGLRRCPGGTGGPLGRPCGRAAWGGDIDVTVTNTTREERYVNVLVDWDGDGSWEPAEFGCAPGVGGEEHVLRNFVVPAGYTGPLSRLSPPAFVVGPRAGLAWVRLTISDRRVPVKWNGAGEFEDGETEDHLVQVIESTTGLPDAPAPLALAVAPAVPNPFNPRTTLAFTLAGGGRARVTVADAAGRVVRVLLDADLPAGPHEVEWDGRDAQGRAAGSGLYLARVEAGGAAETVKLSLLR